MNGKEISINEKYVNDMIAGKNSKTIPHEIGHTGGLQHPAMSDNSWLEVPETFDMPENNFMIQGAIPKSCSYNKNFSIYMMKNNALI
ncbi:hypothetical protein [Chryseobacterium wanjuense]